MLCDGAAVSSAVGYFGGCRWVQVGAGGWCQWACIPVIRALHLVAAGYLQECERRTRSARLKALVLGNASRASSAVLSFVA